MIARKRDRKVALVAGASGVVGHDLAIELASSPDWEVYGIARKPVVIPGVRWIGADLSDDADDLAGSAAASEATHLFYCARHPHRIGTPEPIEANTGMLRNFVEKVERAGADLRHVHVVHGTKWYGSTLGPFPTPALEDDPRLSSPNFYYAQQDYLEERSRRAGWSWSASRPHGLLHAVPDTPRNLVLVIAVYALICKELKMPLHFPGTAENFEAVYQCTSTDHLARAIRFIAEHEVCADRPFNVTNGDYFRWSRVWPLMAAEFGMEPGSVRNVRLASTMQAHGAVWNRIVERHGLKAPAYERLVLWDYGDFVFTPGWDMMSDNGRLARAGFTDRPFTPGEFGRYFDLFRRKGVLPLKDAS